jgi:hypothetical protein
MNLYWLTYILLLDLPLQVGKGTCAINIQKSWPLKGIVPTLANTPQYQTGQGVFQTELLVLRFHAVDMHTTYPKIEEVIAFQRGLSIK